MEALVEGDDHLFTDYGPIDRDPSREERKDADVLVRLRANPGQLYEESPIGWVPRVHGDNPRGFIVTQSL
jgi:hypothetical protein